MFLLSLFSFKTPRSSSFVLSSDIKTIISDFFIVSTAFNTPIFSTRSLVFLIPAVSFKINFTPFISIVCSKTSRVVPSISVTMLFSSLQRIFIMVDLPAFGLPTIETFTPFSKIVLNFAPFKISSSFSFCFFISNISLSISISSISSCG